MSDTKFKELDRVRISDSLADHHGVLSDCTIVGYMPGAPFLTIECRCTGLDSSALETVIFDVALDEVRTL